MMTRIPILFTADGPNQAVVELYRRIEEVLVKQIYLDDIRELATSFHQKVFNKKFFDALKAHNSSLYGSLELQSGGYHKLHIMTSNIQSYQRNDLLHVYNCEHSGILVNNRLNADVLRQWIDTVKDSLSKQQDKLWMDIQSGSERLERYNALATQLNELRSTFSSDFRSLHNSDFTTVYKP